MKVEQKASYVFDAETFSTNSRVTELRLGIPHRVPAELCASAGKVES